MEFHIRAIQEKSASQQKHSHLERHQTMRKHGMHVMHVCTLALTGKFK